MQTIAAFTLGHSITLSAGGAAPHRRAGAAGRSADRARRADPRRRAGPRRRTRGPCCAASRGSIALLFGLLHGFGFAGALAEAGLPAGDVPLALVSFNGGIELGQLAFVGGVLAAAALAARRWLPTAAARSTRPAVYAMGILAAYWCFERVAVWLG